jgi:hypothetical protein
LGFSTKIHAGCLDEKTSISFELTSGARHDAPVFQAVFDHCPVMPQLAYGVMDKGYDSDQILMGEDWLKRWLYWAHETLDWAETRWDVDQRRAEAIERRLRDSIARRGKSQSEQWMDRIDWNTVENKYPGVG